MSRLEIQSRVVHKAADIALYMVKKEAEVILEGRRTRAQQYKELNSVPSEKYHVTETDMLSGEASVLFENKPEYLH